MQDSAKKQIIKAISAMSGTKGRNQNEVMDDLEEEFIKQFTVSGNVHDNPELLQEDEDEA